MLCMLVDFIGWHGACCYMGVERNGGDNMKRKQYLPETLWMWLLDENGEYEEIPFNLVNGKYHISDGPHILFDRVMETKNEDCIDAAMDYIRATLENIANRYTETPRLRSGEFVMLDLRHTYGLKPYTRLHASYNTYPRYLYSEHDEA